MDFSVEVMKAAPKLYGIGQEQAGRMLESAQPMVAGMRSIAMMFAVGSPEDTMYSRMVGVVEAKDATQYMKAYEKYLQDFAGLVKDSKGIFSMKIESKPIDIGGCKGVEIAMEQPGTVPSGDANAEAMLEKMIGPGGKIRVFVVAVDEHHVVFGYTNQRTTCVGRLPALRSGKALGEEESVKRSLEQEELVKQAAAKVGGGQFRAGLLQPGRPDRFRQRNDRNHGPGRAEDSASGVPPKLCRSAGPSTPKGPWSTPGIVVPGEILQAGIGYSAQLRQAFEPRE